MKRNILLLVLTLLISSSIVLCQEKTIEEQEFTAIINKTEQKLEGRIYRLIKTKEYFVDREAVPEIVEINLKETVPPNKWRTVEAYKSAAKNTKTERLWDGQNLYQRENDGLWVKYLGGNSGSFNIASGRITKTYKFLEKITFDNQNVNIYEMETNRIANKSIQTKRFEFHYIDKTKYWITEDGSILKKVIKSEIAGSNQLILETWVYQYDPNIKIEAPIK